MSSIEVPLSSIWYPILDTVADSVNPMLALYAIVTTVVEWRRSPRGAAAAWTIAAIVGLIGIYAVRPICRHLIGHYSTHSAFAVCLVVWLWFLRSGRRALLAGVLFAYLVLILVMGYHGVPDVLASTLAACLVTLPWCFAARWIAQRRLEADRVQRA